MNVWIVLCQAVTFALLLVQYRFFDEVEAEEYHTLSAGGWFGDLEKKLNVIKGVMHDVFQSIKRSAQSLPPRISPHRREITKVRGVPTATDTIIEDFTTVKLNGDPIIGGNDEEICPNVKQENSSMKSIIFMDNGDEYASGLSDENSASYQNIPTHRTPGQEHHKKKKKSKKNKKKIKPKRKVRPKKVQVVKQMSTKPPYVHPKPKKNKAHKKKPAKFVKTSVDNTFNESESNESAKRGKPVDIIVHIKMNE